jgi:ELWxxDGT repeat protein
MEEQRRAAGTALVKDINPGVGSATVEYPVNVNGTLFFEANNGVSGFELWKSNGAASGTLLVKDINPGSTMGTPNNSFPHNLTNVNGTLFFSADNALTGNELWKSNGTAGGTSLVKDISAGAKGSYLAKLTDVGSTLFFVADNGVSGVELWKSNGTSAGTVIVKDIHPGAETSTARYLTNVNGQLLFVASNGVSGDELWTSNGSGAGTSLVLDIFSGSKGSYPRYLTNANGTLFFAAKDGKHGIEPWILSGVPLVAGAESIGSQVLANSQPASGSSRPAKATAVQVPVDLRTPNRQAQLPSTSNAAATAALPTSAPTSGLDLAGAGDWMTALGWNDSNLEFMFARPTGRR